ncbi:MAG TPA: DNA internalization-related competence protein ComEC/Rec2 [Terracidiphilus sp.]|nr:DNA internalization-related competence protein ComEC/Rec2 [Terracidiphilus sp.]
MASSSTTPGPDRAQSASAYSAVPLFHAAWLFAGGVFLAHIVFLRPSFVLLALAPTAFLSLLAAFRAQRILWLPVALLWLLLGAWCAEMQPQPAPSPTIAPLSDGLLRTVDGTVVSTGSLRTEATAYLDEPTSEGPTQTIDLRVSSMEVVNDAEDLQSPASGAIRLTVRWPENSPAAAAPQPFHCGQRVRAVVQLLPPGVYQDPTVWSRRDYLLKQGITSTASVRIESIQRLGRAPGRFLACRIAELQHATSARLLALPATMHGLPSALRLSPDDAAMLAAMSTGDRTYLTSNLRVGFERTGSFHMLVVSGLHLAIVAGFFFWLARLVRLSRIPATLVTMACTGGYAVFTGFATPVQRSLWMILLYLLARLVYRERSALNTIGFAALCLLVVDPLSLFDASLQMTLLAVVSIAGVAVPLLASTVQPYLTATRELSLLAIDPKLPPPIARFRVDLRLLAERIARVSTSFVAWRALPGALRFLLRAVEVLVVSCVVELAMTLPMALYFHRITLFALPVNILILPLLAVLMPAALLTLLALALWPAAAVVPAAIAALFLHFSVWLVHLFGSLALGNLRIPAPLAWQTALFCALLAAALLLARGGPWPRRAAWASLILAAITVVLPRPIDHPHNALLVEAIDVGQGDSILLITPGGKTLLVDGGGFVGGARYAPRNFDIGEDVVSPVLWSRGIRRLDVVALTHAHSDHMGGLPAVLRNFHPRQLWVGNNPPIPQYEALLREAASLHVRVRSFRAGDALTLGAAQIHVLAPFASYRPGPQPSNDDSLVLHVAYRDTSVLLEGDAEAPVEEAMLTEPGLQSSLLKVGHHGSNTSTRPAFLARVAPQWAVISCGLHNHYGHPTPQVLAALQAAGVRTFSTDIDGATCFALNGRTVSAQPLCGLTSASHGFF